MSKLKQFFRSFTGFEWALWIGSVAVTVAAFLLTGNTQYYYLFGSVLGATALILVSKGNVAGQILVVFFSIFYAAVSYRLRYFGEMITYLGMSLPIAVVAVVTWLKNPFRGNKTEVTVNHISALEYVLLVLGGIAVIENAYDETYLIKGLSAAEIITEEPKLKEISYKTIAHLLFDKCDVLVVDKIGKNISGDGMDPNVSGRFVQPKYCSGGIDAEKVVILDLSDETHGNAQGIGLAEVTTRRLFNKMKLEMTYPTGVTNTFLHLMKIPMIMDNDREALQLALCCCPDAEDQNNMKMIRIPNTAHIDVIEISEGMLPLAKANPNIEILSEPYELAFDENGNLF